MAHLLMIESWVGGTGRLFPAAIRRLGHRYTFVARNRAHYLDARTREIHPVIEHADHVLTAETNDLPSLVEFLRRQHQVLGFDGVVTICDYYIDTVADVAKSLNLPQGFPDRVADIRRKDRVREAITAAGLPNPAFAVADDWPATLAAAKRIGFPLVLKPTDLASSAFVRFVRDEAELRDAFDALAAFPKNFREQSRPMQWLLEAYMTGEEVSVEAVTYEGQTTILGITDKSLTGFPYFIEDGHMFPAALDASTVDSVHALVLGALRAVGHDHGISHTEVKLTPEGPRVVEINPRPGGNYIAELIQRVTGIDLLEAQIDLALGRKPGLVRAATGVSSAAIKFLVPPRAGRLNALQGLESLGDDPHLVRAAVPALSDVTLSEPVDNACYLGHVLAFDDAGTRARERAEQALRRIEFDFAD